jgi:hypothetical protein
MTDLSIDSENSKLVAAFLKCFCLHIGQHFKANAGGRSVISEHFRLLTAVASLRMSP